MTLKGISLRTQLFLYALDIFLPRSKVLHILLNRDHHRCVVIERVIEVEKKALRRLSHSRALSHTACPEEKDAGSNEEKGKRSFHVFYEVQPTIRKNPTQSSRIFDGRTYFQEIHILESFYNLAGTLFDPKIFR